MSLNLEFQPSEFLTLGVEVEVQLIDWRNQELCPAATRILEKCQHPAISAEIFQSMVEMSTGICKNLQEVKTDLENCRTSLLAACDEVGVEIIGCGTHPFSCWGERLVYPAPRYRMLIDRNQWIARRLAIFGLHVHIGMRDGDHAMAMTNGLLQQLAPLLALSASSPYMEGHDTGLASARSTIFESQPTAGSPPAFESWEQFADHAKLLHRCRAIGSLKDLWWDIRPNPGYGTVEIRICDGPARPSETLGIVALIQCLAAWIDSRIQNGQVFRPPALWRLRENKWRAARWGIESDFVTDDQGSTLGMKDYLTDLLSQMQPWAQRLECEAHLESLNAILAGEGSPNRQRSIFQQTRSLQSVVQCLAREWLTDKALWEV